MRFDVLLGKVQREVQFRQAPQLQSLDELARMKPDACSSALMASACSLPLPSMLTNTRACFSPAVTRTSLTTTVPSSRGSFSSRPAWH